VGGGKGVVGGGGGGCVDISKGHLTEGKNSNC